MSDLVELIRHYRTKGLLVDTNVLLLYIVGAYDRDLIGRFKRTRDRFVADDYDAVSRLIAFFDPVVTLPNVLTEVSNLAGALGDPTGTDLFQSFGTTIGALQEHYVASARAAARPDFPSIKLTDCAIAELAADQFLVLTDDFELYSRLGRVGTAVLNFNHIRTLSWRFD